MKYSLLLYQPGDDKGNTIKKRTANRIINKISEKTNMQSTTCWYNHALLGQYHISVEWISESKMSIKADPDIFSQS